MIKIILDLILINFSFILAYFFRFKILLFITPDTIPLFEKYSSVLIFVSLTWLVIFNMVGLYSEKKHSALFDEIAQVFLGAGLATLALLGLLFLYQEFWFSRLVIANAFWISFLLLSTYRFIWSAIIHYLRLKGWGKKNALIIGSGEISQALKLKLVKNKSLGYNLIDCANLDNLPVLVEKNKIEEIIIADTNLTEQEILNIITECEKLNVEFKIVPGILELIATRLDVEELAGIPLLTISEIRLRGGKALAKRLTDLILSAALIVLLLPVWLIFPLLIKLTSSGPVFFVQDRVGLDGEKFKMLKFRSMVEGAEEKIEELEKIAETKGHIFKMKDDPRITPIGRFMRHYSIDELPQIFNVFLGQMSLVGPRPPLPREVEMYTSWHKKRLRVRPGITGLWQVSGRSLLPFSDMVRLDIYYIENWSLWLDFKLLMKTIPVVVRGKGAY